MESLVLIRGRNDFLARCPRTHDILDAISGPGVGRTALSGPWIVTCTSEPHRPFTSCETPAQFGGPHL